jgi:purine-binding chemotaxis protein CheW
LDSTTSTPDLVAASALLFRVGANLYGCDIADAQEIIPLRPMTRLPGAPPYVRGLMNMRGTIVTVLDLGVRLDPSRAPITEGSILLVRRRERLVGVIVEEVADVRALDVEPREDSTNGGIVRGVAMADDAAVVLLDLEAIFKQVLLS